ncbi:uncharacterized protein JCM10292_007024 [Rhodotorula paludigena]|uniref:uncharacterized protein n=1 Tax=Rhodotorula paludigena TaxID=86838 RepID=UPI003177F026
MAADPTEDLLLYGGDDTAPTSEGGTNHWMIPVIVVFVAVPLFVLALVVFLRYSKRRVFQRLDGGAAEEAVDDPPPSRTRRTNWLAHGLVQPPPSPSQLAASGRGEPASPTSTAVGLRLLPSLSYARDDDEPLTPSYASHVPEGHTTYEAADDSALRSAGTARLPSRTASNLTLEAQALYPSSSDPAARSSTQTPTRNPSLPPPPYSPNVVGVGTPLSPTSASNRA